MACCAPASARAWAVSCATGSGCLRALRYQRSIVEKPKRTSAPVSGWHQVLCASAFRAACSAPSSGGEANRWPITSRRNKAHRCRCCREFDCVTFAPESPIPLWDRSRRTVSTAAAHGTHQVLRELHPAAAPLTQRDGQGRQEPQKRQQARDSCLANKASDKILRQAQYVDRRQKRTPPLGPEAARNEAALPPLPPTTNRLR